MALIGVEGGETWPPSVKQERPAVKRYDVVVNGIQTTLQLSDEDAKARGLLKDSKTESKAAAPANKSRTPANKRGAKKADG